MTEALERRSKQTRQRVVKRAFEYRQRNHARGSWYRLRRLLADAVLVYEIPVAEAERLVSEGYPAEPAGLVLEPPKLLVFVPRERLASVSGARAVPVRLGPDVLGAPALALVRF